MGNLHRLVNVMVQLIGLSGSLRFACPQRHIFMCDSCKNVKKKNKKTGVKSLPRINQCLNNKIFYVNLYWNVIGPKGFLSGR